MWPASDLFRGGSHCGGPLFPMDAVEDAAGLDHAAVGVDVGLRRVGDALEIALLRLEHRDILQAPRNVGVAPNQSRGSWTNLSVLPMSTAAVPTPRGDRPLSGAAPTMQRNARRWPVSGGVRGSNRVTERSVTVAGKEMQPRPGTIHNAD